MIYRTILACTLIGSSVDTFGCHSQIHRAILTHRSLWIAVMFKVVEYNIFLMKIVVVKIWPRSASIYTRFTAYIKYKYTSFSKEKRDRFPNLQSTHAHHADSSPLPFQHQHIGSFSLLVFFFSFSLTDSHARGSLLLLTWKAFFSLCVLVREVSSTTK